MEAGTAATCIRCKKQYYILMKSSENSIYCPECSSNAVSRISTSSIGCSRRFHPIRSLQSVVTRYNSKLHDQRSRNFDKELLHKDKQKSSSSSGTTSTASKSFSSSFDSINKPSPSVSSAQTPSTGRKRALLCGVTHRNKKYSLSGTVNDVRNMKNLLIQHFGYSRDCIRILTEEAQGISDFTPTKKNILDSLKWLVEGSESGDLLVFYYSGHGLRQPESFTNEEEDGFDETICPVDFMQEGMIPDNEIHSIIVRPLKKGVTLHAIVDACHSGTILDLHYTYDLQRKDWKNNKPDPSKADESRTSRGLAICLSACGDDQITSDTNAFSKREMAFSRKEMNGAMTAILIQMVGDNPEITYEVLLDKMQDFIQQVNNKSSILNSRFLQRIFLRKTKIEDPLLSSSQIFSVSSKKFLQ